jgi:hypothetical protein
MTAGYTPPEFAKARRVSVGKVLHWIDAGDLQAINQATKRQGRPRWFITAEAIAEFDVARSSWATKPPMPSPPRSRSRKSEHEIAYY